MGESARKLLLNLTELHNCNLNFIKKSSWDASGQIETEIQFNPVEEESTTHSSDPSHKIPPQRILEGLSNDAQKIHIPVVVKKADFPQN